VKPLSKGYLRLFSAVLQGAFRFAVFPKRMISFNPMQYVVWRGKKDDCELFSEDNGEVASIPTLTHEMYLKLEDFLKAKDNPALLPIQIAYYTGLRIGEVCGLTWQDVNLEKTVPYSTPQYALQQHQIQDGDRGNQTQESPHGGLL